MKKLINKILIIGCVLALTASFAACTYRQDGSVIQDVYFDVTYTDADNQAVNIDGTLKLYKTFAPKTCNHVEKLIKNGYYNNSAIVYDKDLRYAVIGAFKESDDVYSEIIYTGNSVKGEFDNAGWESKLEVEAGSLVMLREPDTGKGSQKHDTAKATFAIILVNTSAFNSNDYCVFGKVSEETVTALKKHCDDTIDDDSDDVRMRYVGNRDDNGLFTVENGKYTGGFEFYKERSSNTYKYLDKTALEEENIDGSENLEYKKISEAISFDIVSIPTKAAKLSNFKFR